MFCSRNRNSGSNWEINLILNFIHQFIASSLKDLRELNCKRIQQKVMRKNVKDAWKMTSDAGELETSNIDRIKILLCAYTWGRANIAFNKIYANEGG